MEKKHILVVDDNSTTTVIFGKIIQALNLEYTPAYNGLKAIEKCYENRYNLIFMDINMPIMNGFSALNKIRNISEWYKQIPIIGTTAEITSPALVSTGEKLFDDFIMKPLSFNQIKDIIIQYLNIHNDILSSNELPQPITGYVKWNYIKELSGNEIVFEASLLQTFIQEGKKMIDLMQQLLLQGKWQQLQKQAHRSKQLFSIINNDSILPKLCEIQSIESFSEKYLEVEHNLQFIKDYYISARNEINDFLYQQSLKGNVK